MFQVCDAITATDTYSAVTSGGNKFGDTGSLNCVDGYRLTSDTAADNINTSVAIECSSNGQWNVSSIICEKKGTI